MKKIINVLLIAILSVVFIGLVLFVLNFAKDMWSDSDTKIVDKHQHETSKDKNNKPLDNSSQNNSNEQSTTTSIEEQDNNTTSTNNNSNKYSNINNNNNDDISKMRVNRNNVFDYLKKDLGSFENLKFEEPTYNYEKNCWEILATNKSVGNQLMYYVYQDGGVSVQMQ
ncbi:hypothetical protein QVA46_10415 [Staphylococcus haemolyticus]|uniref:hypothetical protein n=1 Tax=Staphylococcus haemolyticus TaxID=1283 RepID=UPI002902ABD7|nr:hypothetical protein [Staphylococcus haemolyticus]MDU0449987.1 hypothetical protein [Staphylococcus haemolyticus]MDU0485891.1 hypothetical protein [Staphylococcus haemolyticus]MDU0491339.1 hypothetical protein [Staphylococcus haemolyticus]